MSTLSVPMSTPKTPRTRSEEFENSIWETFCFQRSLNWQRNFLLGQRNLRAYFDINLILEYNILNFKLYQTHWFRWYEQKSYDSDTLTTVYKKHNQYRRYDFLSWFLESPKNTNLIEKHFNSRYAFHLHTVHDCRPRYKIFVYYQRDTRDSSIQSSSSSTSCPRLFYGDKSRNVQLPERGPPHPSWRCLRSEDGFMLHDRLLRPAQVGVSSTPAS